jgi:hypothetical protein
MRTGAELSGQNQLIRMRQEYRAHGGGAMTVLDCAGVARSPRSAPLVVRTGTPGQGGTATIHPSNRGR